MAATTYNLNAYDGKFLEDLINAGVDSPTVVDKWNPKWQTKAPTYNDKAAYLDVMYTDASSQKKVDTDALLDAAGRWLQAYNPNLTHSDGTPYTLTEFKSIVADKKGVTATDAPKDSLLAQLQADRNAQGKVIAASLGDNLTADQIATKAKNIMNGSTTEEFYPNEVGNLYVNAVGPDAISPTDTVESLTAKYGNLKTSTGKALFTPAEIKAAVSGSSTVKQAFNTRVRTLVDTAVSKNSDLVKGSKSYTEAANKLLTNAPTLESTYNTKVSGLTKNADTGAWQSGTTGTSNVVTSDPTGTPGKYDYTGGIQQLMTNDKIDPVKMKAMVDSYDTQKGVWSLPTMQDGKFVANTSPYGQVLTNSLNSFLTKGDYYSPNYVNSLASKQPAAISSTDMPSLKATFTDPGTSKDLLNLANSVGTDYATANDKGGITAGSKLSPTLLKAYQPITTTNATGQQSTAAKPGAPDLTSSTVPKTTAPVTALPSTTPGVITAPTITTKEQADALKVIADQKLKDEQSKLAKENAEKLKLNQPWYKAGFVSPEEYSAAMGLGFSDKLSYDNYLKNLRTTTVKGGTGTDTLPGGTKIDTLPGGTKTDTLPGITGLNTPIYNKSTDSYFTYSDQAKAKDIQAQLDALGPVKSIAATGAINVDSNTNAGQANIAAGNSSTAINASWDKSPNNPAFVGSPFYDPSAQDRQILNDQLNAIRTTTDQTGTIYNWDPRGEWVPQNQGIAANTSNFTTPENMNTNAGGIPTVLPNNTPAAPASDIPGVYGGAGPGAKKSSAAPAYQNTSSVPQLGLDQYRIIYGGAPTTPEQEATARSLAQ